MRNFLIVLLVAYVAIAGFVLMRENLIGVAAQEVAAQCSQAIPRNVHTRLVAVTDIKGDDGTLTRAITDALKADTHFQVIERNQLDTLLKEQALQISDLVSAEERIRPGMIRGVEGLVHGEIIEKTNLLAYTAYRVHLKMTGVQTGEILLSKEISSSLRSKYLLPAAAGLATLVIAFFAVGAASKIRGNAMLSAQGREQAVRKKLTATLKATIDSLRATEHGLSMDSDKQSIAILRELRANVELLHDKMLAVRFADIDTESSRGLRKKDSRILDVCEDLLDSARAMAATGGATAVSRRTSDIRTHISRIEEMLTNRQ